MRATPDYAHPLPRPNLVVDTVNWVDKVGCGYAVTDATDYGPPNKYVQMGPAFAGVTGVTPYDEASQEHPSHPQDTAPPQEQKWFTDARPLSGPGPQLVDRATRTSGQLYKFSSVTTDGDNLTYIGGPNAATGGVNRKRQPTMSFCGAQPLTAVSSPTQGNAISDTHRALINTALHAWRASAGRAPRSAISTSIALTFHRARTTPSDAITDAASYRSPTTFACTTRART